jgi:hypothetical protein
VSVRLRNLLKRRPRPDMGWSVIEEEELHSIRTTSVKFNQILFKFENFSDAVFYSNYHFADIIFS